MRNITLLLFSAIILWGCASNEVANSGDVKQNTIHQHYSISYNEGENVTWATATFRFGGANGTTLVLTKPSTISFNGDTMRPANTVISGARYTLAFKKPLENGRACEFLFTDTEGKKYSNKLKFNPILMGTPTAEIKQGMPLELPLFTAPLLYGDNITVTLKDTNRTETYVAESMNTKGSLLVPATVLKPLSGKVTITIERRSTVALQEANEEGGEITYTYTLKPRVVYITP